MIQDSKYLLNKYPAYPEYTLEDGVYSAIVFTYKDLEKHALLCRYFGSFTGFEKFCQLSATHIDSSQLDETTLVKGDV